VPYRVSGTVSWCISDMRVGSHVEDTGSVLVAGGTGIAVVSWILKAVLCKLVEQGLESSCIVGS
jgi:hypothetical protein